MLRIEGKPPWRRAASERPILLLDLNGEAHRFAALPAPEDPRGMLRAAYSVPSDLVADQSKYWLEHADGAVTELPRPEPGAGRDQTGDAPASPAGAASGAAPADERAWPAMDRRSDLHAKLAEQSQELAQAQKTIAGLQRHAASPGPAPPSGDVDPDEPAGDHVALERQLEVLRTTRASLEKELDQSRDQLRVMTFERDELSRQAAAFDEVAVKARERAAKAEAQNEEMAATLRELEVWRGELERRLAATTSELGVSKAAREADERELKRLRETPAEAELRVAHPDRTVDSSQTLADQAAEIELLMAELSSLRAQQRDPRSPSPVSEATPARDPALEAERAEVARRAQQLLRSLQEAMGPAQALAELAGSAFGGTQPAPGPDSAAREHDLELISRAAEQAASEQAQRELRSVTGD
jgi:myosin heavy subunit